MSYQNQSLEDQRKDAEALLAAIDEWCAEDVLDRLHDRLRTLGRDGGSPTLGGSSVFTRPKSTSHRGSANDEIAQLRQLQKACKECEPLAVAIARVGGIRLDQVKFPPFTPEIGHMVQVFNRMVEDHWEDTMKPKRRKVIYTEKDNETV